MKMTLLEYLKADELKIPFKHLKVGKTFLKMHKGKKRQFKKIPKIKDSRGKYQNCNLCGTKQLYTIDNETFITVKDHNINQNLVNLYKYKLIDSEQNNSEVLWENEDVSFNVVLEEGKLKTFIQNKIGGIVQGSAKLFRNPFIAASVILGVTDAVKRYKKNKKLTTHFYASDINEKKFYEQLIDDLLKTGNYTLVNTDYAEGNWIFELKRNK